MNVRFSERAEQRYEELAKRYESRASTVMPALYIAQEEHGYIDDAAIEWVSKKTGIAPVHVLEVATFYTMYYKKPVGRYHIQACRTLSCELRGARKIIEYLQKRLNLKPGEVSSNGMWSYEEVECLGSCGTGPMCEINDRFFENLTEERLEKIIQQVEKEKPDLSLSVLKGTLGAGLAAWPKSEIMGPDHG